MKLLLDENLSYRILAEIQAAFPGSAHVGHLGLQSVDDHALWRHARDHGFVLVTQDSDFHELATLYGAPPKVIWLKCGNRPRWYIAILLLKHREELVAFVDDTETVVAELS
ncbi:MAG: hypothetical protein EYC71_02920 [Gammaproteobacteria bacterium]|nr:MAG: hypothetical protein EYC71_02920 [Gammaproteobacteria bacterium]